MEQNKIVWIVGVCSVLISIGAVSYAVITQKQSENQFRSEVQQQYNDLKGQINNFSQKLSEISSSVSNPQPTTDTQPATEIIPDDRLPFQMGKSSYFGTIVLKGYAQVSKGVPDCGEGCDEATAPKVDVVYFNITSSTKVFDQYLAPDNGNSFEGRGWISLGCITTDKKGVESYNAGDSGTVNNLISGADFTALMNSSNTNQINLQVTKPYYTSGKGVSTCYSHFRNFKVK